MDKLPNVFANPIDKKINNVQETYLCKEERSVDINPNEISKKINMIFSSKNHVYKSKVRIKFKDHEDDEVIVGRTNVNLLTMAGKLIKIADIIDIKSIS